jgi:hypothetical protein
VTPAREKRINENLLRTYNDELRELKKTIQGNPQSDSNLKLLSSRIKARNKKFLEGLKSEPLPVGDTGGAQAHAIKHAGEILNSISEHPVVGDSALHRYDRDEFNVGFCFGRAAYAHIELLRKGVHPKRIGKVFAIGKFQFGKAAWDFHVTTVVRGPKNEWWAIDRATSTQIEPIEVWMSQVERLSTHATHPLVRFYFSDAVKFHPLYGAYGADNLYFPYFNNYFVDLARWFDDHPVLQVSFH